MAREVIALKAAAGTGVPRVLDENTSAWEKKEELFVVLEYVSGDTLQKYVSARPQSLDTALDLTEKLVEIVRRTHASQVMHRDIKPDNIILKENNVRDPVLVDFGLAWLENEDTGFQSRVNQEIGNRFLRLPEHAADQDTHHDPRSDLTQIVGVLLYLLSGVYPRLLVDANGRRPDEVSRKDIPPETLGDVRWPSVQSIFIMGFRNYSVVPEVLLSSYGVMTTRKLIVFKHVGTDSDPVQRIRQARMGCAPAQNLLELGRVVSIRKQPGVLYPRSFSDYVVDINPEGVPAGVEMLFPWE